MQIKFQTEIKKIVSIATRFPFDIVLMLTAAAAVRYIAVVCSLNIFLSFIASLSLSHLTSFMFGNRVSGNALVLHFFFPVRFFRILTPLPRQIFLASSIQFLSDWMRKLIASRFSVIFSCLQWDLTQKIRKTKLNFFFSNKIIHCIVVPLIDSDLLFWINIICEGCQELLMWLHFKKILWWFFSFWSIEVHWNGCRRKKTEQ